MELYLLSNKTVLWSRTDNFINVCCVAYPSSVVVVVGDLDEGGVLVLLVLFLLLLVVVVFLGKVLLGYGVAPALFRGRRRSARMLVVPDVGDLQIPTMQSISDY